MKRIPVKRTLNDCWLSGDDKERHQTEVQLENSHQDSVPIDNSIVELVKTLNKRTRMETVNSCSGVFSEHYDTDILGYKLPYDELSDRVESQDKLTTLPSLHTKPTYHKENDESIQVSKKFYELKHNITEQTYDISNQKVFGWQLKLMTTSGDRFLPHNKQYGIIYKFEPYKQTFLQSLKLCSSYDEVDKNIKYSIDNLQDFLLVELKD